MRASVSTVAMAAITFVLSGSVILAMIFAGLVYWDMKR